MLNTEISKYLEILNDRCKKLHAIYENDKTSYRGKKAYKIGMNIFHRMQFLSLSYYSEK